MAKKSKFLKNLLTTASAATVLIGGVHGIESAAAAAARTTAGNAFVLNTGFNLDGGGAVPVVDGSSLTLTAGHSGTVGAVGKRLAGYDIKDQAGTTFGVDESATLGSVIDSVGVNKSLSVVVTDAKTLTLDGQVTGVGAFTIADKYTALGNITLGTGAAGDAVLTVNLASVGKTTQLFGKIDGDAGDDHGTLNTTAGNTVTFNGAVGSASRLKVMTLDGTTTFSNVVKSKTITVAATGVATFNNAVTVGSGAAGTFTVSGQATFAGGATNTTAGDFILDNANSILNIKSFVDLGAKAVQFTTAASANSGRGIVVDGANAHLKSTGNAVDFNDLESFVTIKNGGKIEGVIQNAAAAAAAGKLVFGNGGGQVVGTVGSATPDEALTLVQFANSTTGESLVAGKVYATTIEVADAKANARVTDTITGAVSYTAGGTLTAEKTITGSVAFGNNANAKLILGNDAEVTTTITGNGAAGAGKGTVEFLGKSKITGKIGAGPAAVNTLRFKGATTGGVVQLAGTVAADTLDIADKGAKVEADAAVTATNIIFSQPGQFTAKDAVTSAVRFDSNGTFVLEDGKVLTGAVTTTIPGAGIIDIQKAGTIDGAIGAGAGASIGLIKLGSADVGVIALGNNAGNAVFAQKITVGNDGTDATVAGALTVGNKADGNGIVYNAQGKVTLSTGVTGDVNFSGQADGTLVLADKAGVTGGIFAGGAGKGKIDIQGASTITGAIGSSATDNVQVIDVGTAAGGNVSFQDQVYAATINIKHKDTKLVANKLITGNVIYDATGSVTASGGIKGNVDFVNKEGKLILAAGQTIDGAVNASTGDAGTLSFVGAGRVTGAIGAANNLTAISFDGAGDVSLDAATKAADINFTVAGVNVTAGGNIDATNIDFKGQDSKLIVADGSDITAVIKGDGTGGKVVAGRLVFKGASVVTGEVGNTEALTSITFENTNAAQKIVEFTQNVSATTLTFDGKSVGGTKIKIADKTLTGAVEFNGDSDINHVVELADNGNITGSVDNKGSVPLGTVKFKGTSTVTGEIGAARAVKLLDFNGGGGATVTLNSDVKALTLKYTNAGAVVAKGNVIGDIDFNGVNGDFTVDDTKNITGKVLSVGGGNGNLIIKGTTTVSDIIGTTADKIKLVEFDFKAAGKTATLQGAVNATTLQFNSNAGTVIAQKDVTAALEFNSLDGIFVLPTDGTFTGSADDSAPNNKGILRVDGNTRFVGTIGDANSINKVLYSGDFTLTVDSGVAAGVIGANAGIDFDSKNAVLVISGNQDQDISSAITNAAKARVMLDASIGSDKSVTFTKAIGVDGKSLNTFQIGAGVASDNAKGVILQENAYIATAIFDGATNLALSKNGLQLRIGAVQMVDNVVSLKVENNATLLAGTNLSNGTNKLKEIDFVADRILTIEDGVNVSANSLTASLTPGDGTLLFLGGGTFDAKSTGKIGLVDAKALAAGKTLTFISDINATNITGGAGTLAFAGNVTGAVDAGANNQGTVQFVNKGALNVAGTFGGTKQFATMQFSGGDVTFAANVNQSGNKFVFDAATPTTVTFDNTTDLANAIVENNSANAQHVIILSKGAGNLAFNTAIGSNAKPVEVRLSAANTNAQVSVNTGGAIITATDAVRGSSSVEFTVDVAALKGIGAEGKNLAKVTFTASGTTGDTYADLIEVEGTKTATFTGVLSSNDLKLKAAGATAVFGNGATLGTKITAVVPGEGIATFNGSATINQAIGLDAARLKNVTFASATTGAVVSLSADVSATNINSNANTTLKLDKNLTFNGTTSFSSLDLQDKVLTTNNAGGTSLALTKNVKISTIISGSGNAVTGGQIKNAVNSKSDMSGLTGANISIDDSDLDVPEVSRVFTLLQNDGAYVAPAAFNPAAAGKAALTKWVASFNGTGSIILTQSNESIKVLSQDLGANAAIEDQENADILGKSGPNVQELNKITNSESRKEYIERVTPTVAEPVISDITSSVVSDLGDHLFNLAGFQGAPAQERVISSAGDSGISAGDDASRYGAWLNPFYAQGEQKSLNKAAGYKATTFGGVFGFDTKVNDNSIFGAALALLNTEIKFKNFKSGDKTKADSVLFSAYGMQQITNNIFAQAVATFGTNRVETDEKRITGNTSFQKAKGKYNSISLGFEALAGYNYVADQMVSITPMAGFKYTRVNDDSYKETGTTNQNLSIHKKSVNNIDLVAGVRVSGGTFDIAELAVTPEVHSFVNYDVLGKRPKVTIRLDGTKTPLVAKIAKPSRLQFNAGVGLNSSYSYMEYGIGYDAHIAKKYLAHQGTLKIRVNF